MEDKIYNPLQLRELFHLEFLRWLARKVKPGCYAVKGGVNLRFFFNSFRYSEDMDLDVKTIGVDTLRDVVMAILQLNSFQSGLKPFGIEKVVPPDITKAKQTQTTQRFKVHLITAAGEDLFTKIECSRRGFKGRAVVEPVASAVLREYKLAPLLISHYDSVSAFVQKVAALANRAALQARDIFDLYILTSQINLPELKQVKTSVGKNTLREARQRLFEVSFSHFRDTVLAYLSQADQRAYNSEAGWDEVKLRVAAFLAELEK